LFRPARDERPLVRLGQDAHPCIPPGCARRSSSRKALPADLAFLAIAQARLGNQAESKSTPARLRRLAEDPVKASDQEAQAFLREAEEAVEGKAGR
jgi:hypothetical protein